jgi:hypothetical protein
MVRKVKHLTHTAQQMVNFIYKCAEAEKEDVDSAVNAAKKAFSQMMGPLVNEAQFNKVLEYVKIEKEEDAKVVYGGEKIVENGSNKGYFVESTTFIDVYNNMRIAQKLTK